MLSFYLGVGKKLGFLSKLEGNGEGNKGDLFLY